LAKRKKTTRQAPATPILSQRAAVVALVVVLAIFAVLRLRLRDFPLERDEGEYAYAGQLILQGIPPYQLEYNMKWPGTYAAYAALMAVFGETAGGIRIGLLIVTTATALLIYFLVRRLFGRAAGAAAAATQALLSISVAALAVYAHATHFVVLPAVAGFLLIAPRGTGEGACPPRDLLIAGALFALAGIMKQPGVFFGIFAVLWLLSRREVRDASLVIAGASAVLAAMAGILALAGVFGRFWFWTIDYMRQYATNATLSDGADAFRTTFGGIIRSGPLPWLIALVGLAMLFIDRDARRHWKFVAALTLAGAAATVPGLYFREHYFITLFPAVAVLNGIAVETIARRLRSVLVPLLAAAVSIAFTLAWEWPLLVNSDATQFSRAVSGENPFPEAVEVGRYLREHTLPTDRIAVLGSEPEIYFYANRKSATGYVYTYPLVERHKYAHKMQLEMIAEIEKAKPKYLVAVFVGGSWLNHPESDKTIFQWIDSKIGHGYVPDGLVEIEPSGTKYTWGAAALNAQPQTESVIVILKRT
jgi:hypothetical protein